MSYITAIIITTLIIIIAYMGYQLYVRNIHYQYKADKMSDLEHSYEGKIQNLESAISSLNKTAYTHTVTKIGNIDYFINRCSSYFERFPNSVFTMIGFSISNLGKINQFFGPSEGDKVMVYTADTLKNSVQGSATYAHVNSNLFGILLRDTTEEEIMEIIGTITENLKDYSPTFAVTAVFGIYYINRDHAGDSLMDIMNYTLLAQKAIKDPKTANYAYFTDDLIRTYNENKKMSAEMEEALDNHKFIVYLQPMIDLHSYQIVSAEALVRWDYPGKGILSPYAFLPLFENTSLIQKLDYYMWEECCKVIRRWIDNKMTPLPISMNISPLHLQSTAFIDKLEQLMHSYLISKELLVLELPERGVANASREVAEIIMKLKERGFSLCIDNFGSVHRSEEHTSELQSPLVMAKELNLTVITEGVESLQQANFLSDIGCDIAQGYFFAKPLDVRHFDQLNKSMLRNLYRPSEYYPTFEDFEKDVDILAQMMQRVG